MCCSVPHNKRSKMAGVFSMLLLAMGTVLEDYKEAIYFILCFHL
jgi:hypothetical protein